MIAGLALVFSLATWLVQHRQRRSAERRADVTVFFHWLTSMARVVARDGRNLSAGYHLVLKNNGPAAARDVSITVRDTQGQVLRLVDVDPGELPLAVLDVNGRYPIPFLYEPFTRHARRFEASVSWTDDDGHHERVIPLRRGQLPT